MNTTHLESFIYVAKYASISKAAQKLNYSNSTVQGHIKSLEDEFGTKFYDRTSQGIQLTHNGTVFLKHAREILDITDNMREFFAGDNMNLRITASESVNVYLMNSLIQGFIKKNPHIGIEYTKAITGTAVSKLLQKECDVSLIAEPHFQEVEGINCKFVCKLPLAFVTSPKHICFKQGLAASRDYNTLFCTMSLPVLTEVLEKNNLRFEDYFSQEKNIGDLQMLRDLAYEGHIITLLPRNLIEDDLKTYKLKIIPELDCNPESNVYLLTAGYHPAKADAIQSLEAIIASVLIKSK